MQKFFLIISFVLGFAFYGLLSYLFQHKNTSEDDSYVVLTNQIEKMNKMIVAEQTSSSFVTHKSGKFESSNYYWFPKEMMVYSEVKAQVTYDLKLLKYKVDSVNKKLIIEKIPNAEIKFYPNSKIHFMDESVVNDFDKNEINAIIAKSNNKVISKIDQTRLRSEGRKQLLQNLNDIFVLAKALHFTIEDKTGQKIEMLN